MPKSSKSVAEEDKPASGAKWSFSQGTNFLSSFGAKVERESKMRLNDFAKELRSFSSIDMSGIKKFISCSVVAGIPQNSDKALV